MILGSGARGVKRTALAVALALAAAAGARAQSSPAPGLRGPEQAPSVAPAPRDQARASASAAPRQAPPQTLAAIGDAPATDLDQDVAPRFTLDPAPRTSGLSVAPGGAQCRRSCADDRYLCRSTGDAQRCDTTWSQCVAACPEGSPDPL